MRTAAVRVWLGALLLLCLAASGAQARTICSIVADEAGATVFEEGDCATRVTPASTFKVPLAVIAFDARVLTSPDEPVLPFREGYADWGDGWREATGPKAWMHRSVLWYSRLIAREIGAETIARYLQRMDYGNADFSGDPGAGNALDRAWISSSLKISPREQVAFMSALSRHALPVTDWAQSLTIHIMERHRSGGWTATGKTGSAYPRLADGTFDRARGWGWYAGWIERNGRRFAFARLAQDETRHATSGGLRARAAWLEAWPAIAVRIGAD